MLRAIALAVVLAGSLVAPLAGPWMPAAGAQESTPSTDCAPTTEAENQAIVQGWFDGIDAGDLEAMGTLLAPVVTQDAVDFPNGQGSDEVLANLGGFIAAFPDLEHEITQSVADDDLVAARIVATGTHQGEFQGIAPTGNEITWTTLSIYRIECGQIAQIWSELSAYERLQQLGAIPAPPLSPATPASEPTAAEAASTPADCPTTSEEQNEALISRWYAEVLSEGNFDNIEELVAPSYVHHRVLNRTTTSPAARAASLATWNVALPDLVSTPEMMLTDGDLVATRWTATGTHEGQWEEVAPSGNTVTWTGNTIFRIACGQIAEEWSEADSLSFFQQLGVVESPPSTAATPAAD